MTTLATVESDDYDVRRGLDRPKGEAMRIGELASRTGVSVRALRYYEEQQLLTASRSATGQRLDDDAVGWVDLIQQLYAAGLSSSTILKLLPCVKEQDPQRSPHSHALLHAERARIDEQIVALQRTRDTLDSVILAAEACATLEDDAQPLTEKSLVAS
jgi:DNA-binding transcriptional MerR regulator